MFPPIFNDIVIIVNGTANITTTENSRHISSLAPMYELRYLLVNPNMAISALVHKLIIPSKSTSSHMIDVSVISFI